jgi:hypothetical protein
MIKLTNILLEVLNEDRCKRIADRRYSKPSAYKSGAIVRCRKGKIWKGLKEEISAEEAYDDKDSIKTVLNGKRKLGFIVLDGLDFPEKDFWDIINKFDLGIVKVPSNPHRAYVFYVKEAENEANELKDIAEKYNGYLSHKATDEDARRIGQLLGYKAEDIEKYISNRPKLDEAKKETLRTWFKRKGAPGKTGGWVDCNTCRDGKCKPCGRKKGEVRAKYPSCRPTPSQCKRPGKGKTWGKTK